MKDRYLIHSTAEFNQFPLMIRKHRPTQSYGYMHNVRITLPYTGISTVYSWKLMYVTVILLYFHKISYDFFIKNLLYFSEKIYYIFFSEEWSPCECHDNEVKWSVKSKRASLLKTLTPL